MVGLPPLDPRGEVRGAAGWPRRRLGGKELLQRPLVAAAKWLCWWGRAGLPRKEGGTPIGDSRIGESSS
eukprot:1480039-Lingulodinium_polyedra.AAC.1